MDADPLDIFVWPDGFWCFREEHHVEMLRSDDFRQVSLKSKEWLEICDDSPLEKRSR